MISTSRSRALKAAAAAGLLFLHIPLALILLYAFTTEEKSYQFPPPGYTLKWFSLVLERQDIWDALFLSVRVAAISTLVAMIRATPTGVTGFPWLPQARANFISSGTAVPSTPK